MDSLKSKDGTILTVSGKGYAKRTELGEYRLQGRGGTGIINFKVADKNGPVVQVMEVAPDDQVVVITAAGKIIRTDAKSISLLGRPTQGVRLIHLEEGDSVVAVARVAERDDEVSPGPAAGGPPGAAAGSAPADPDGGAESVGADGPAASPLSPGPAGDGGNGKDH